MPHNIKTSNTPTEILIPTIKDNPHLLKILEHFDGFTTYHPPDPEDVNYLFICYTNRSGSNYLAELLESSGQYNLAGEDLNWETALDHKNIYNFNNFHEYFNHLVRAKQKSGTFILKTAISHIEILGASGILDKIIHRSKFLVIQRGDKLGQAISHALAFSTGKYTSWMEGTKSPEDIAFSEPMVTQILQDILEAEHQYGEFFALNGIVPTYLTYEQIVALPPTALPLHCNTDRVEWLHTRPVENQTRAPGQCSERPLAIAIPRVPQRILPAEWQYAGIDGTVHSASAQSHWRFMMPQVAAPNAAKEAFPSSQPRQRPRPCASATPHPPVPGEGAGVVGRIVPEAVGQTPNPWHDAELAPAPRPAPKHTEPAIGETE